PYAPAAPAAPWSAGCAPASRRVRPAQGLPGVRADDAVHDQSVPLLEALDRALRLRPEDAVDLTRRQTGPFQQALHLRHLRPGLAVRHESLLAAAVAGVPAAVGALRAAGVRGGGGGGRRGGSGDGGRGGGAVVLRAAAGAVGEAHGQQDG